jgi:hypothetical protein
MTLLEKADAAMWISCVALALNILTIIVTVSWIVLSDRRR